MEVRTAPIKTWVFVVHYFGVLFCEFTLREDQLPKDKKEVV